MINNSIEVLQMLSSINGGGRVECFDSYDFSTCILVSHTSC